MMISLVIVAFEPKSHSPAEPRVIDDKRFRSAGMRRRATAQPEWTLKKKDPFAGGINRPVLAG